MINKRKNVVLVILLILIIVFILTSFYLISRPIEVRKLEVSFIIAENAGFDLNKSALTFGKVVRGSIETRKIIIENKKDFPVKVRASADENIENYLNFEKSFFIDQNERYLSAVTLNVPKNASFGSYKGMMTFVIEK